MDQTIVAVAAVHGGYLFRHQLLDLGVGDRMLAAWHRAGELVRVRHGTYVPRSLWAAADDVERLAIRTRSVLDKLGPGVIATHSSAAALHGLDIYQVDASTVHVTRVDGRSGRREAGVVYHENVIDESADIVDVDGRSVSAPRRAVLEVCADLDVESGMVTASSALRRGDVVKDELEDAVGTLRHWPGVSRARLAVRLSDGALESVGEVRSLHMMWSHGLPRPELQVEVRVRGRLLGRSDFGWLEWCHLGEFDGLLKYGRSNPHPADPGRVLAEEKAREDALRATGVGMSRWTWGDLAPGARASTVSRIRTSMESSRRLYSRERRVFAS